MKKDGRIILLGFDGLEHRLCRHWMKTGLLPNLSTLAATGTFQSLHTSYPCQSPVAWRTFATGVNPGNHGVFDFLRKIPGTYLPNMSTVKRGSMAVFAEDWKRFAFGGLMGAAGSLAAFGAAKKTTVSRRTFLAAGIGVPIATGVTSSLYSWLPKEVPTPVNCTGGTPFWAYLGKEGVRCKVLRIPVEFPARDYPNCKVLSGLGVPDIRATNGTYTIFTEDGNVQDKDTEMGGRIVPIQFHNQKAQTTILGPLNVLDPSCGSLGCSFTIFKTATHIEIAVNGTSHRLAAGEWTKWLRIPFSASPFVNVHGRSRFYLVSLHPLRLYLAPVNFDPADLPRNIRISSPASYANSLAEENGFFQTLGWPTDTWALNEEHIPDDVYLAEYRETMRMEKAVTHAELGKKDWDCLIAIFTPTDQIQHVFRSGTERGDAALLAAYQEVDAFVGEVMAQYMDAHTTLVVLSDHGFHGFDRAVNINTWLWRNGYLAFKGEVLPDLPQKKMADLTGRGQFWHGVDWSNTYAYSMGLGNIYLNLRGREPEGIVRPGAMVDTLLEKLREGLLAFRDAGVPVVRSVYLGRELYQGNYAEHAADVVVGFHDGYRVSWQTALGGVPTAMIEPNNKKWSGDHCSLDPAITPGVLFANRSFANPPDQSRILGGGAWPSVMDIAPSVLSVFGLKQSESFEGSRLWV